MNCSSDFITRNGKLWYFDTLIFSVQKEKAQWRSFSSELDKSCLMENSLSYCSHQTNELIIVSVESLHNYKKNCYFWYRIFWKRHSITAIETRIATTPHDMWIEKGDSRLTWPVANISLHGLLQPGNLPFPLPRLFHSSSIQFSKGVMYKMFSVNITVWHDSGDFYIT